jgi:hypothetical protein
MALTVLAEGPGFQFAIWRNLYIIDFASTPTVEGLRTTVRAKQAAVAHSPSGLVVLNFLAPGPLPSAEVREAAAAAQKQDTQGVLCHATVVEATGFAGSAMRSVLTGLNTFERSTFPRKVFGDVEEALVWQAAQTKAPADWQAGARQAISDLKKRRK